VSNVTEFNVQLLLINVISIINWKV